MNRLVKVLGILAVLAIGAYLLIGYWLRSDTGWSGLPLVELPVPDGDNDTLAVILSGDGGWADLDRQFGEAFQQSGMATVGFDCLKYFWKARKPDEVARDLSAAIAHYLERWSKRRLLLVGYSFGASWLPWVANRLPADIQQRVTLVAMLAPAREINVEIKAGDWLKDIVRDGALDVYEEASRLALPTLCVYGRKEAGESLCPQLRASNIARLEVAGGHHFDRNYGPLIERLLQAARP